MLGRMDGVAQLMSLPPLWRGPAADRWVVERISKPACPVATRNLDAVRCFRVRCRAPWTWSILKRPEGKTLEFKRDLSSPDGALKTVVAFANTAGGTLLVGVEDRTRHVRDVSDALDLEERLASLVSDRISPHPGLLPFGLTIEDLPRGVSKLRNPLLGRVFHPRGLIEQWGSGVQRMTAACQAAGLPAPVFEEIATRFRVTIATARVGPRVVEDTDQAILGALGGADGLATSEIAAAIGFSPRATRTRLARLLGRGLLREIGTGPQDPRRRYFLAEQGPA